MNRFNSFVFLLAIMASSALALLTPAQAESLKVVTTTPLLADLAREVGGEQVQVSCLIPLGTDPHGFRPTPQDLKTISGAGVVLASGKGMESYVKKLRAATGEKGIFLEVGDKVPGIEGGTVCDHSDHASHDDHDDHAGHDDHDDHASHDDHDDHAGHNHAKEEAEAGHDDHAGHDHGAHASLGEDPHWWQSIHRTALAATAIAAALGEADPAHAALYAQRASEFATRMEELERWGRLQFADIPRDQRKLVTAHDAFRYLGEDFQLTLYPVAGLSTADAPSARRVAEIIDLVRSNKVQAIFVEDTYNPQVLEQIIRETGARLGGKLWAAGPPQADQTYEDFVRHNITTIVAALRPAKP